MFWCTCFGTKTLRNMNGLDLKKIYFVLGLTYSLKWTNCSKKTHQRKCLTDEREREKKKIQLLYPVFINTIPEWRKGQRLKTLTKIWPFLIISPIELRRSPSLLEVLSTEGQTRICMKCKIIVLSSTPVNCFLLSLHRVPSDGSPIGH